ncbi:uncharacterized protein F4812DRAFT_456328 [Daldinia caldariorum]|uniref:uncharacterized protein n=1 Tax=Daldinia caldariorum TaxID=326644 RepID=UPI00200865A7|nr:uncharacterized protein F4812DRAFT_456328 [Daldinia caldariorum]KAI1470323.1 hypothetical protein F4812DRAFT_456328 [Daldinia caldariorum]
MDVLMDMFMGMSGPNALEVTMIGCYALWPRKDSPPLRLQVRMKPLTFTMSYLPAVWAGRFAYLAMSVDTYQRFPFISILGYARNALSLLHEDFCRGHASCDTTPKLEMLWRTNLVRLATEFPFSLEQGRRKGPRVIKVAGRSDMTAPRCLWGCILRWTGAAWLAGKSLGSGGGLDGQASRSEFPITLLAYLFTSVRKSSFTIEYANAKGSDSYARRQIL